MSWFLFPLLHLGSSEFWWFDINWDFNPNPQNILAASTQFIFYKQLHAPCAPSFSSLSSFFRFPAQKIKQILATQKNGESN